ncbi:hypothetical protein LAZ67_14002757 [Cordylochernes scorpioides]|uniref:Mos1 transposase HTH domain-containing protein n=1 Tax=Cordylochernes scorpioides TaxID=51811 RepID=A0ABY6LAP5_9ARAC|nr:hypothetical protein LAZ67_14002757 [Cordylochernes scorpioides]
MKIRKKKTLLQLSDSKMDTNLFRTGIKCFFFKRWSASQIKAELNEVHRDSAPSFNVIYYWMNEFKQPKINARQISPRLPMDITIGIKNPLNYYG